MSALFVAPISQKEHSPRRERTSFFQSPAYDARCSLTGCAGPSPLQFSVQTLTCFRKSTTPASPAGLSGSPIEHLAAPDALSESRKLWPLPAKLRPYLRMNSTHPR